MFVHRKGARRRRRLLADGVALVVAEAIVRKSPNNNPKPTLPLTAGFGYEFFSHADRSYRRAKEIPSILTSTFASIKSVLLFEPGERWNDGVNIDWVGKVVED